MTTLSPRKSPLVAKKVNTLIEYYAPIHHMPFREDQSSDSYHNNLQKTTIRGLACKCETDYVPRSPQWQKANSAYTLPQDRQTVGLNKSNPVTPGKRFENPNIESSMGRSGAKRGQEDSSASSRPGNGVESSSQPPKNSNEKKQLVSADSAVSLLTPKEPSKASHTRRAQSATVDANGAMSPGDESPPRHTETQATPLYPSPAKTALIMLSLYISIFLVALDRTIMGPAIPAITNQFNSIDDIGWYGSAYMLTSCGFILLYGRVYTFFPTKPTFLSGIFLFEIGSTICGAAQSSIVLIIGRAIAGLGSSGVFTGAILIMLGTVPLHRRPLLQGLFGACFGVASVAGPLLGGAFTGSRLTWRWCFYINIPLGAVTILVVIFLLDLNETESRTRGWKDTVRQLDPLGTVLFLPSITCLLLALEWGAAEYSWDSPRLVALLAGFAALLMAFMIWQFVTRNTTATVPAHILLQRSVACGCASQFCVGATMLTVSIYIPLWFQAIKGVSAFQSGINCIPLVLSTVVGSISSGGLVQRIGYYTPFMVIGSCCMAVGTGLITTLDSNTDSAKWISFLVILGFGVGFQMGHSNLAVQVVLDKIDVPIGTAILSLFQTLGGAVFTAVGQNLYISKFSEGLQRIEGVDASRVLGSGATDLTTSVSPELRERVLEAYNNSLTQGTFLAALFIACLAVPAALGMEWRSVKEDTSETRQAVVPDLEMNKTRKRGPAARMSHDERTAQSRYAKVEDSSIVSPIPVLKKGYRSSRQFSQWAMITLNPDLRSELNLGR